MAIRAYSELYLEDAQAHLGIYFDLGRKHVGDVDLLAKMFLDSGFAARFGSGDPFIISGMSGSELAVKIFFANRKTGIFSDTWTNALSPEYWLGHVLAYYQWYSARSFAEIFAKLPASKILSFYNPYHEMDILSLCEKLDSYFPKPGERLKQKRRSMGFSQSELALLSNVPLRSIQQYEQGSKSLEKAAYETVLHLANALGVEPKEIL